MKNRLDDFLYDLEQELRALGRALSRSNTWIAVGVLAGLGLLIYFGMKIALRYDQLMALLGAPISLCRALSNYQYMGLIYLLFFFALAVIYCLGSLTNYLRERDQRYRPDLHRLALHTVLGGFAAVILGALATGALYYWC